MRLALLSLILFALMMACASGGSSPALKPIPTSTSPDMGGYFVGVANGWRFLGPNDPTPSAPSICGSDAGSESTATEVADSTLQFKPRYIPPDMKLATQSGRTCNGSVVAIQLVWAVTGGDFVGVGHGLGEAAIYGVYPAQNIRTSTINGKASLVIQTGDRNFPVLIFMKDKDGSVWKVSTSRSVDEALKVARGIP